MKPRYTVIMTDGHIDVEQATINGHLISYNPDDGRFYVHDTDEDQTTLATFKQFRNAVQFAKRK